MNHFSVQGAAPTPTPTVQQLAAMSAAVYNNASAVGGYAAIQTAGPNANGLAAIAYKNGNQIVVAFRGTVSLPTPSLSLSGPVISSANASGTVAANFLADASWLGTTPNPTFSTNVNDAANFLASVQANNPGATITLTGHSLGGAIAEVLGDASGYPSTTFNAPGAKQFEPSLQTALAPTTALHVAGPSLPNTNYRIVGDQVSLVGTQTGTTVNLNSGFPDNWANALNNHGINTVINALNLGSFSQGPMDMKLPGLDAVIPDANGNRNFPPFSVTAGENVGIDPVGASKFIFGENPGSPPFSTIALSGGVPGVASYNLISEQNGVFSPVENVLPTEVLNLPFDTTDIIFQALDSNGNPVILLDPGILDVTFALDGVFSGFLDSLDLSTVPGTAVPEPPTVILLGSGLLALGFAASNKRRYWDRLWPNCVGHVPLAARRVVSPRMATKYA